MPDKDWYAWHDEYDRPGSCLARRLAVVQARIADALDEAPPGRLRVLSLCAGQGRDLIGVLATHPRAPDVTARLVEYDPANAAAATRAAAAAGLAGVEVRTGDAARTDQYADLAPADLVLLCGIFGNVGDDDIRHTIAHLPGLCATGATVVWTRHRRPPDLVPQVCDWFTAHGFECRWLSDESELFGVGAHRYVHQPRPLNAGVRLFTFEK